MSEITISGAIKFQPDAGNKDGGEYKVQLNEHQTWGIPVRTITPEDLRAMADHLEAQRKNQGASNA